MMTVKIDAGAGPREATPRSSLFRAERWLAVLLFAFGAYYVICYALSHERPAGEFLGWAGWADQGWYLREAAALARGDLGVKNFFYPPLYAMTAAPFWSLLNRHATVIPDLICFMTAFGTLLAVSRRFYGRILPALVCAALFAWAPVMSIQQWVIPWTSSLTAALGSILILIYARVERAAEPFRLGSGRDWLVFGLFYLAYGAFAASRPFEILVWLPMALGMFLRTAWATAAAEAGLGRRLAVLLQVGVLAGGAAAVFVAVYLGFNELVDHNLFGPYGDATLSKGYFVGSIPQRLFSFLWNSSTAFVEPSQALFERFPVFGPLFAVCLVTLVTVRDVRSWIVATAIVHFLLYLPYGDLLPNGFFRYYNLHYFKWAYPWLAVIGVGQTVRWLGAALAGRWRARALLAASAAVMSIGWALQLEPVNLATVPDLRTADQAVVVVAPAPRKVEFIDIPDVSNGFIETYFGKHELTIDGRPFTAFRLLPKSTGIRLLLLHPQMMGRAVLRPDPRVKIEPGLHQSVLGETRIMPAALYRPVLTTVSWTNGRIDFDFKGASGLHGVPLDPLTWAVPEPGGRWTTTHRASLGFNTWPPAGDVRVTSSILPLHNRRVWGFRPRISLWINDCRVAQERIDSLGPRVLQGVLPAHCVRRNGDVHVEWRTDHPRSPRNLHIAPDDRMLGVNVIGLSLTQAEAVTPRR